MTRAEALSLRQEVCAEVAGSSHSLHKRSLWGGVWRAVATDEP